MEADFVGLSASLVKFEKLKTDAEQLWNDVVQRQVCSHFPLMFFPRTLLLKILESIVHAGNLLLFSCLAGWLTD